MIKKVKITAYKTEDGRSFLNREEAENMNKTLQNVLK